MAENEIIEMNGLQVIKLSPGIYRDVKSSAIITQVSPIYTMLEDAVFNQKKRVIVLEGGTRSTKTYSVVQFFIDMSLKYPKLKTNIVRKHLTRAKQGIMLDFHDIMSNREIYDRKRFNGETYTYTYPNLSTNTFIVAQDKESVKGVKQHFLILDEATEMEEAIYLELQQRTKNIIILTFNPCMDKEHWIYRTLLRRDEFGDLLNDDVIYIHSTYKDNCFLTANEVRAIERYEPTPENVIAGTADKARWEIYGLGKRAEIEGVIFKYEVVEEMPEDLEHVTYAADFGFSPDPFVFIQKGEKQQVIDGVLCDCLYFDEIIYERELLSSRNSNSPDVKSIQQRLEEEGISKCDTIYGDRSSPQQIADLQASGYNIQAANQTAGADRAGSINYGISIMKSYRIFLTERSINGRREMDFYREERRENRIAKVGDDHFIDACRYACLSTCPKVYLGKGRFEPLRVNMTSAIDMRRYG
jgi:phage terminase large subunit